MGALVQGCQQRVDAQHAHVNDSREQGDPKVALSTPLVAVTCRRVACQCDHVDVDVDVSVGVGLGKHVRDWQ